MVNPELLSQPFIDLGTQLAGEQDIEELTAFINHGFRYHDAGRGRARVTEAELQERMQADPFYVIREDGAITANITTYPKNDSFLEVGLLVVAEHKRGRQIGRNLIRAAELDAKTRGYDGMALGCFAVAGHLRKYYEQLGYRIKESYTWQNLEVVDMTKLFDEGANR